MSLARGASAAPSRASAPCPETRERLVARSSMPDVSAEQNLEGGVAMATPLETVQHDAARQMSATLVNIIIPCLRPEEVHEARREFYEAIRRELVDYESNRARVIPFEHSK